MRLVAACAPLLLRFVLLSSAKRQWEKVGSCEYAPLTTKNWSLPDNPEINWTVAAKQCKDLNASLPVLKTAQLDKDFHKYRVKNKLNKAGDSRFSWRIPIGLQYNGPMSKADEEYKNMMNWIWMDGDRREYHHFILEEKKRLFFDYERVFITNWGIWRRKFDTDDTDTFEQRRKWIICQRNCAPSPPPPPPSLPSVPGQSTSTSAATSTSMSTDAIIFIVLGSGLGLGVLMICCCASTGRHRRRRAERDLDSGAGSTTAGGSTTAEPSDVTTF